MNLQEDIINRLVLLEQKADHVLNTYKPNSPGVIGFPTLSHEAFTEWQTQCLSYLINLLGEKHTYSEKFKELIKQGYVGHVEAGKGILKALIQDIQGGYLRKIENLISSNVFSDFLEMAEHLLEQGYKDAAASLCGAILEDGLRKICISKGLTLKSVENISSLNQKLSDASIYTRLTQKKLQVWNDVRNNADHGFFDQYTNDDVKDMLKGIQDFLEKNYT